MNSCCAIILAGGKGERMNSSLTKQRISILGKSVLRHTLLAFEGCDMIDAIVVVCRAGEEDFVNQEALGINKLVKVTRGGACRAESARLGFEIVKGCYDYVAIHDGARCLITPDMIKRVVTRAYECGAASASTIATDTIKIVDSEGFVVSTPDRKNLMLATTPQIFSTYIYSKALENVQINADITDDNMLVEKTGTRVSCVDVGRENIKITTPMDVYIAELILKGRENE